MAEPRLPRAPEGSEAIRSWAATRGLVHEALPDEAWFRKWEPYDTMAPASHFYNACTWMQGRLTMVVAEPWFAPEDAEPLERTLLGFATHPGIVRRAAARAGEHFLTRVVFLESLPPPRVPVGEKLWDENVATFAASSLEASTAFNPPLRKLLAGWGFSGHIELRAGGMALHLAGVLPSPSGYDRVLRAVTEVVNAAISKNR